MENILIEKLLAYITVNNPDLLVRLQGNYSVTMYLKDKVSLIMPRAQQLIEEGKPLYAIQELCIHSLTDDLRPSRYNYIKEVLEDDFLQEYERFRELGVLTYEIINIIEQCNPVFNSMGFNEDNEDDRNLKYTITGVIGEYLGW